MSAVNPSSPITCAACGTTFHCGYRAGDETCWCFHRPRIEIDEAVSGCFCPNCLHDRIQEQNKGLSSDEENRISPTE